MHSRHNNSAMLIPPCESSKIKVSGQLPPDENCLPVRVGVRVRVRISFGVGGNQTIALEEKCPRLVLGFGLGLVLVLWGGGGAVFLGGNYLRTQNKTVLHYAS